MVSLTMDDNLILDYDPFIYGQDWDENVLIKSLEIKPLKNKNEYRVSFFRFEKNDEKRTNIDLLLKNNSEGKPLIYSILNDEYLNFSNLNEIPISEKENNFNDEWLGTYKGQFLRIKEESADPRAYAMINITIKSSTATFKLDSYKEIINKNLTINDISENKIILSENDNKNNIFIITKHNSKLILKSVFIDKITGDNDSYEIQKE